ncbi:VWA domain-containing protein [Frateuria sp. YIM B11624]|uniref:VWA domain-containing protein n=1 Tax=Frateuria sp. YIM B11624 TaxID=3143185 RepID=UPI003C72702C
MKTGLAVKLLAVAAVGTAIGTGVLWLGKNHTDVASPGITPTSAASIAQRATTAADASAPAAPAPSAPLRKTYPAGRWDIAVPFINPFGAQKAYVGIEHAANGRLDLRYVDKDNMETVRSTSGETWQLQVDWQDKTTTAFDDLSRYVTQLGGETWPADRDGLVVHARDGAGDDWWGVAFPRGDGYRLTVCRQLQPRAGKPLALRTADFKDGTLYFTTTNPGHRFQSLKVTLADGAVTLYGSNTYLQGRYRRDLAYQRTLYAYKTHDYTLDDLPQDGALPIQWKLSWSAKTDPKQLTIALDEGDALMPVHDGERLGALKVRGAALGEVRVGEPAGVSLTHPELDRSGTLTPDGDTLFWLPSGYWNVTLVPDTLKAASDTLGTRLVPVSAGQMTVLDVGSLVDRAYRDPSVDEAAGTDSQLRILDAAAQGDQATVDFMLQDGAGAKLLPTPDNTQIVEGGKPARILRIERLKTPPSLVLVLDSSGSMRKSMTRVLASARSFIQGLPDNTRVQLIDFDSQIRPLKGTGKADALRNLGRIRADGSTALYDAVLAGLKLLGGEQRPTLVVFTDGVDSREDHSGKGSSATKAQVKQAVADAHVPLFTIGFGRGHDGSTLKELAGMSEGTYYSADDADALQHVFASINDRLGNRYAAIYERPREAAPSDLPVITLATDVSLSMDTAPTGAGCDYCNYRIDKMKNLYHAFIERLPANSLTQLISFSGEVNVSQVFTQRKSDLLQALGSLQVRPGTDILGSVRKAYLSLKEVPAEKRVIVYLTDAALDVDKDDQPAFEKLLQGIKADGIQVLWVGMGTGARDAPFRRAAELSGGRYVISEDPAVLAEALQDVLADARARPAGKAALTVTVSGPAVDGHARRDSDTQLLDFPVLQSSTERYSFDTISYRTGLKAPQYGAAAAALVYGRDIPSQDVILTKRLALDASGKNRAMEWHAREMYLMKRFHGIDAPGGQVFLALDMTLKNIQSEGAPYLIPDFASHFFVTLNQAGAWPASPATWLAQSPLAAPGENDIRIEPDQTVHGALVFLVPDAAIRQASADFYDTSNGHVTLPLIGTPAPRTVALTALPKSADRPSDTFALSLTASQDMDRIEDVDAGQDSLFKVLEARMDSKMQADLHLAPSQRFFLTVDTPQGPFMLPVNNATSRLPFGFLWPVTLAPGSSNQVRFAFQLPAVLRDAPMRLYCDLAGGAVVLPVHGGTVPAAGGAPSFHAAGMDLTVNALATAAPSHWPYGRFVVADITVANTQAGTGLSGLREAFRLVPDGTPPADGPATLSPDALTDRLALGIDKDWQVFDGGRRRGLLVFAIPRSWGTRGVTLQSTFFPDLRLPLAKAGYAHADLLVDRVEPAVDDRFDRALALALKDTIARHRAQVAASRPPPAAAPNGPAQDVPVPPPALAGAMKLKAAASLADVQALLRGLRWLPSSGDYWHYRHAPESVLTQGWGDEGDLANLAGGLLARLGYAPALRAVTLTDAGRKALAALGHVDEAREKYLPAWSYADAQGNARVLVVPFMKDLSELDGLAFYPADQEDRAMTPAEAQVRVYFQVRPRQTRGLTALTGSMADALTGASAGPAKDKEVRVLRTTLPMDTLGRAPVDIRVGAQKGLYTAVLENQTLQVPGDGYVDPHQFTVTGVRIELALPGHTVVHTTALHEGEDITGVFFTLGANLPDLPLDAAAPLQKAADAAYHAVARPTVHSALAWYTRSILYRLVAGQSRYEADLARQLGVTAGRTDRARALLVTVQRYGDPSHLRTSVDLMQSANDLHGGAPDARHAFNLMSGMFASQLEAAALPLEGADYSEVWRRSPDGTNLLMSLKDGRNGDLKYMQERAMPAALIAHAKNSDSVLLVPSKPTRIYGEDRWAWLEIDPDTYETIAMTDTGEHGSFADYVMALEPVTPIHNDYLQFMIGGFVGVDTAVWSVSSFSLESSDYREVLAAAEDYTAQIGEVLAGTKKLLDLKPIQLGVGPIKVLPKASKMMPFLLAKTFEDAKDNVPLGVKQNVLTFAKGFQAGAAYYFKQAQPHNDRTKH